jgi:hypothetical protein
MFEDPASYLAARVNQEHTLSEPPTEVELLAVCSQRGVQVATSDALSGPGYYRSQPHPLIVVRTGVSGFVTAHELFHHLVADNAEYGIRYEAPEWSCVNPEAAADRFAGLLCGSSGG